MTQPGRTARALPMAVTAAAPTGLAVTPLPRRLGLADHPTFRPTKTPGAGAGGAPLPAWRGLGTAARPGTAETVAIGASQAGGVTARGAERWPAELAARSGRTVYSMATGGYGPVQYAVLAEEAAALHPRVVFVALYFG